MENEVSVEFVKDWEVYKRGEVVHLKQSEASGYVTKGVAKIVSEAEAEERKVNYFRAKINTELWRDSDERDLGKVAWWLTQYLHIRTTKDTGEIFVYDKNSGIYLSKGEVFLAEELKKEVEGKLSTGALREILFHVRCLTYTDRDELNSNKDVIVLENGRYHLVYNEFRPHSPITVSTWKLPVYYNPSADCPGFLKFLREVVEPQHISTIQEWFGYCLCRGYPIQKAAMLVGDGANGKSTLLSVLKSFLGSRNVCHVSPQDLSKNRFASAQLYGKLANICSDLSEQMLEDSSIFKMLTGGDEISGERKFRDEFNFTNSAKLTFACNKVPTVRDDTPAFFRRWILIRFPNVFSANKADPKLVEKLTTQTELSGIFNWAVHGYRRLMAQGRFTYDLNPEAVEELYHRLRSPERAFLQDCTVPDQDAIVEKDIFYNAYREYCKARNLSVCLQTAFARRLKQIAPYISEFRPSDADGRKRVWKGVKLI